MSVVNRTSKKGRIVTTVLSELEEGVSGKSGDRRLDKSRRASSNRALIADDGDEAEAAGLLRVDNET